MYRCGYGANGKMADQSHCESKDKITKWLLNKQLEPLAFDNQPALKSFDKVYRVKFTQYAAVPFGMGIKSDLWFRFRENVYSRKDNPWWPTLEKFVFSSIRLDYSNWI